MHTARRYTTMAAAAGILTALLALPAGTQNYPAIPDLDPANCSNGTYLWHPERYPPEQIPDCQALVSIRNHWTAQGLPPNSLLLNWGTGYPTGGVTHWHGINQPTKGHYRVIGINLTDTGLNGPIPAELSNLTELTELDLSNNELTGPIPAELVRLTNLDRLHLYGNRLTGRIPLELARLTDLEHLNLYRN